MREKEISGNRVKVRFSSENVQGEVIYRFLLEIYENNNIFKYVDVCCVPKYTIEVSC